MTRSTSSAVDDEDAPCIARTEGAFHAELSQDSQALLPETGFLYPNLLRQLREIPIHYRFSSIYTPSAIDRVWQRTCSMENDLHGLRFGVELCLRAAPAMDSKTKVSKSTTSRVVTGLLLLAAAACVLIALLNLADRSDFQSPHDGVTWIDRPAGVESLRVELEGPGAQAGIRAGDRLVRIDSSTIDEALDVARTLARVGVWRQATYVIERAGARFETRVIVGAAPEGGVASSFQWIVGLAYLAIGLTVLLSRVAGPMVHHFFLFTLVSFVLHCFSYTTRLDGLDRSCLLDRCLGNAAGALVVPSFLSDLPGRRENVAPAPLGPQERSTCRYWGWLSCSILSRSAQ